MSLMISQQRNRQIVEVSGRRQDEDFLGPATTAERIVIVIGVPRKISPTNERTTSQILRAGQHNKFGNFRELTDHDRHAGLENASLLRSNQAQRVSKNMSMIKSDARDDIHQRTADVGTIQSPAKSGFQDGDLDAFFIEVHPRQ